MSIQAIQTRYKGYKFRSRLEARWAVFFDALGIKYSYEHEGFHLPSGDYLPDFWLPDLELWFEIKGSRAPDNEVALVRELADYTGDASVIWQGLSSQENHYGRIWCCDVGSSAGTSDHVCSFVDWKHHGVGLLLEYRSPKEIYNRGMTKPLHWIQTLLSAEEYSFDRINIAEMAGRSARFEHGETP